MCIRDRTQTIGLGQAVDTAKALLEGQVRGRVVVDVNAVDVNA